MKLTLNRKNKPFHFEVENEVGAKLNIDAARAVGGQDAGLRPMELVASGLAGCVAIDVLLILQKQRLDTDNFRIEVEANRKVGTPSPFENIHLIFLVDKQIDKAKLKKNIQLVLDKYCSVRASLDSSITLTFEIKTT